MITGVLLIAIVLPLEGALIILSLAPEGGVTTTLVLISMGFFVVLALLLYDLWDLLAPKVEK